MAKMTKKELTANVEKYIELQAQIKALTEEADALKDALKKETAATESRTLIVDNHTLSLVERTRSSISVKEFTAAHPRLAAKFTKVTSYDVFTVK